MKRSIELNVFEAAEHSFIAGDLPDERREERFTKAPLDRPLEELIHETFDQCLALLPEEHWPRSCEIQVQREASVSFENGAESQLTPLSLITTKQIPPRSLIRLAVHEMEGSRQAMTSILAHELGHMLLEWPCREYGVTREEEGAISHLARPIYEGVADFVGAVVSGAPSIGDASLWFHRDILEFEKLDEASAVRRSSDALIGNVREGLGALGLYPDYRFYRIWVDEVEKLLREHMPEDPYALGQWLAGRLWKLRESGASEKKIVSSAIELALEGTEIRSPIEFLQKLSSRL